MALLGGNEQSLNIVVRLKDEASQQLEKFKGKVEGMQPAFTKMAAVGTAAFVGISAVALKSVQAYAEVERAQRQLEHAVIGVSKGTQEQVKQIEDITAALEKKAGVDADALKMGAAQLSTFGLQSKSVVDLTKSLADLTVNQSGLNASADDYVTSANTIAKALNGQFGVLEKSGIRFTEAQQNLILYGTEAEKVAALQEGLNQNLRETTDTVAGTDLAMAKLARATENIQENLGAALAPAFAAVAEKLQPLIEQFAAWAEANPELLATLVGVGAAIAAIVAVVGTLGLILPPVIAGFTLLLGPVGLVILAIAALVAGIVLLVKNWAYVKEQMKLTWDGLKIMFKEGVNYLIGLAEGWANMWVKAANFIIDALNKIKFSIPDWVPKIGGKSFGINIERMKEVSLPRLEQGGFVPGARGTAVPIIAHGGEQIIPAGQAKGGGDVYIKVEINNPSIKSQEDITILRKQVEDVFRDVVRVYKLQSA